MNKIIIASGPVIIENNQVLLDQHGDDNFWKFCGGQGDLSENLFEIACKRAKEEIGIDLELINPEPFFLYTQKQVDGEKIDIILVHWFAKRVGEIVKGEDVRAIGWHDINNLPENLAPNIIPAIKHFNV